MDIQIQSQQTVNGRKSGGFSLRRSLIEQGVTEETVLREHLGIVHDMLDADIPIDITRYRVSERDPNMSPGREHWYEPIN